MKKIKEKKEVILTCIIIKRSLIIILFNTEIQVQVHNRITLAELKEELVPLIGVPSTGFRVYGISGDELDRIKFESKVYSLLCYLIHFSFPLYPL